MYWDETRKGFQIQERDGVVYYTIPSFSALGFLKHGFSTRIGGVSSGCFQSLNMSFSRETASLENVVENVRRMGAAIGIALEDMVRCNYEHGTNVLVIDRSMAGEGILRPHEMPFCDGLIATDSSVAAVTLHADCNPIFFADKRGRAAGVCHAGWRGTLGGVTANILGKLRELGVGPGDVLFGIGPSIGPCCFEVQDDVSSQFLEKYGDEVVERRDGRQFVDLWRTLALQLEAMGVPPENVTFSMQCTYCREELFYSHRRDKGQTGAMGSFIQLCGRAQAS